MTHVFVVVHRASSVRLAVHLERSEFVGVILSNHLIDLQFPDAYFRAASSKLHCRPLLLRIWFLVLHVARVPDEDLFAARQTASAALLNFPGH